MTMKEMIEPIKNQLFPNHGDQKPLEFGADEVATAIVLLRQVITNQQILSQKLDRYHAEATGKKATKPKKESRRFRTGEAAMEIFSGGMPMSNYEVYKAIKMKNPLANEASVTAAIYNLFANGKIKRVRYGIYQKMDVENEAAN